MRKARQKTPGSIYHICNYTANKEERFTDPKFFSMIHDVMYRTLQRFDLDILAESLTSNSVQWVINTPLTEDISEVMKYLKQVITQTYNRMTGRSGPLWDDRYKSRLLQTSAGIEAAIHFVHYETDLRHIPDFDKHALCEYDYAQLNHVGNEEPCIKPNTKEILELEEGNEMDAEPSNPHNSIFLYRIIGKDKQLSKYFCVQFPGSYIFIYERVMFCMYKKKQGVLLE